MHRRVVAFISFLMLSGSPALCAQDSDTDPGDGLPIIFIFASFDGFDGTNKAGLFGQMVNSATIKRSKLAVETLRTALPDVDLPREAFEAIRCRELEGRRSCAPGVVIEDDVDKGRSALARRALEDNHWDSAWLVMYLGHLNERGYWARIRAARIERKGEKTEIGYELSSFYFTMLPKDQMAAYKEFWGRGSGSRLDREIRHSWSELRDMWLRTAADARDGISIPKAWKTLPKAKKALKDAGWKVHCAVLFRCSGQYVVQLKDDRVWMSFPDGPVLFSIDRVAAEFSGDALSYSIF